MTTVESVENQTFHATDLAIGPDSTNWVDSQAGQTYTVSTSDLRWIEIKSHSRGAIDGLAIGSGIGAFSGFVVFAGIGSEDVNVSSGEAGLLGAIIFGGAGSILGVSIGAALGSKYRFILDDKVMTERSTQRTRDLKPISVPPSFQDTLHNRFYVEIFRNALLYSLNYERLLERLAIRIGFMYSPARKSKTAMVFPLSVSRLIGRGNKKLELALGTVFSKDFDLDLGVYPESGWSGRLTFSVGYRNEPKKRGFLFRAGPTLVFERLFGKRTDEPYFPWFGLSFGYAF